MRASQLSRHKDDYEDIVEERRTQSDVRYVTRSREVPTYKYNVSRSHAQLKQHVMKSDRVRYTVEQVGISDSRSVIFFI